MHISPLLHLQGTIYVQKVKGEVPEVPKGIYTNPAKKGTFGMNKFTLSERTGYKVRLIAHWAGRLQTSHGIMDQHSLPLARTRLA